MTSDPGVLAYIAIFVAAAVEGEIIFVAASAAVASGGLSAAGVLFAGALGASAGDQAFFHAVRHWPRRWSDRLPASARAHLAAVTARVRQHATLMILACRFLPGLRIAIPVACAASGVPARRFVVLDLLSAFAWTASIMLLVAKAGPAGAARLGLHGPAAILVPALVIAIVVVWGGKALARTIDRER
jgi:membrane protein DedA with SNARE-associated domain